MTAESEQFLRKALETPKSYSYNDKEYSNSIMVYGNFCPHDTGYLCECRLNWLIEKLKENEGK